MTCSRSDSTSITKAEIAYKSSECCLLHHADLALLLPKSYFNQSVIHYRNTTYSNNHWIKGSLVSICKCLCIIISHCLCLCMCKKSTETPDKTFGKMIHYGSERARRALKDQVKVKVSSYREKALTQPSFFSLKFALFIKRWNLIRVFAKQNN